MKSIKLFFVSVAVFAALLAPLSAQTAKKPSVVIMPFDAKDGVAQEDCDIVTDIFESEYVVAGNSTVVNRSTLSKIQAEQKFQASDWSNNSKTAQLGKALNAQQIVSGQIRLYNGLLFFTAQVQDIRTLAVLASVSVRTESTMQLLDKIPGICKDLASQIGGSSK